METQEKTRTMETHRHIHTMVSSHFSGFVFFGKKKKLVLRGALRGQHPSARILGVAINSGSPDEFCRILFCLTRFWPFKKKKRV